VHNDDLGLIFMGLILLYSESCSDFGSCEVKCDACKIRSCYKVGRAIRNGYKHSVDHTVYGIDWDSYYKPQCKEMGCVFINHGCGAIASSGFTVIIVVSVVSFVAIVIIVIVICVKGKGRPFEVIIWSIAPFSQLNDCQKVFVYSVIWVLVVATLVLVVLAFAFSGDDYDSPYEELCEQSGSLFFEVLGDFSWEKSGLGSLMLCV
jgi:hypothetical protein